jgi:hypothetical protein
MHAALAVTGAAAILAVMAGTSAAAPSQAPVQQAWACKWERLKPTLPQSLYFMGSAWDSVNNKAYLLAGLDRSDKAVKTTQVLDLSDPDIGKATAKLAATSGAYLEHWATAGAFRPKGDASAAYFVGGAEGKGRPAEEGSTFNTLQTFVPKTSVWNEDRLSFQPVTMAAAAYDPDHDVVISVGGVGECDFFVPDTSDPLACEDALNQVAVFKFDPTTGAATYSAGPTSGGPGRVFGGTLVYDSKARRMLYFGGTDSADGKGKSSTSALDLKDPDLAKAKWSTLATAGSPPPGRALHAAAYDEDKNWLVVYGGATDGFFTDENTLTDTWALDLGQAPPRWSNLGASTPSERVAADMVYATNHKVPILIGGREAYEPDAGAMQAIQNDAFQLNCAEAVPTPSPTPRPPTNTPVPGQATATPGTWVPESCSPKACPGLDKRVPQAVIDNALANPDKVLGYCRLRNPGVPASPFNPFRTSLTLSNSGVQYNPVSNGVVYKAGCY